MVEEPGNIAVIEKTRSYNGVYHVLHGTLSPLHGVGPEHLRTDSLLARVAQGDVEEVILATNPTVEGEATAVYLADLLRSARSARDPHRHRSAGRERHRVCRRGHHDPSHGGPAGAQVLA